MKPCPTVLDDFLNENNAILTCTETLLLLSYHVYIENLCWALTRLSQLMDYVPRNQLIFNIQPPQGRHYKHAHDLFSTTAFSEIFGGG
jgi:hypothetical protein